MTHIMLTLMFILFFATRLQLLCHTFRTCICWWLSYFLQYKLYFIFNSHLAWDINQQSCTDPQKLFQLKLCLLDCILVLHSLQTSFTLYAVFVWLHDTCFRDINFKYFISRKKTTICVQIISLSKLFAYDENTSLTIFYLLFC